MKFHEIANIFPMMTDDEIESLAKKIETHGYDRHYPIYTYEGKILDGRNRYSACTIAGVKPVYERYEGDDPLRFVVLSNLDRRHLNESQRATCAARVANMQRGGDRPSKNDSNFDSANLQNRSEISQSTAAAMFNVSERSVASAKTVIDNAIPELVKLVDDGNLAVSEAAKVIQEDKPTQKKIAKEIESGLKPQEAIAKVTGKQPHVSYNSGDNEWYTPRPYIDAALEVLGEIDLDPASSEVGNTIVGATKYYSLDNDGLSKKWRGKVWMNPPYASELIGKFTAKLAQHFSQGDVSEAIILVNNATETSWFGSLIELASAVVFPVGRIKFLNEELNPVGMPLQGQAVIYLGKQTEKFLSVFFRFGWGALIHHKKASGDKGT